MTIPQSVVRKLDTQARANPAVLRAVDECTQVLRSLQAVGVSEKSQIGEFFLSYRMTAIVRAEGRGIELLDICDPTEQICDTTAWVRDFYGVGSDFICLDMAEAGGFVLYRLRDGTIFDIGAEDVGRLAEAGVAPRWLSFFALMDWYIA